MGHPRWSLQRTPVAFKDHFSAVASEYASARPEYPDALFAWIASISPARACAWDAGCGSGQASRGLAPQFDRVRRHRSERRADRAGGGTGKRHVCSGAGRAMQPGRCQRRRGLRRAGAALVRPRGVLRRMRARAAARRRAGRLGLPGYRGAERALSAANAALQDEILADWPPERSADRRGLRRFRLAVPAAAGTGLRARRAVDAAAAARLFLQLLGQQAPSRGDRRTMRSPHTRPRSRHAWGEPDITRTVRWPMFVHARRKDS